jgi:hypothetical protein
MGESLSNRSQIAIQVYGHLCLSSPTLSLVTPLLVMIEGKTLFQGAPLHRDGAIALLYRFEAHREFSVTYPARRMEDL